MIARPQRSTARIFFALVPDPPLQAALATLGREIAGRAGGRSIPAANVHLTLAFIGDVPADRIEVLQSIVRGVAGDEFTLALDRIGTFRKAEVAWIAPTRVPEALMRLHAALANALLAAEFPPEQRPFHAHLTLARRCTRTIEPSTRAPLDWRVKRVSLMESEPAERGVRYVELAGAGLFDA